MKRYSEHTNRAVLTLLLLSFVFWAQPVHFHCHTAESHSHSLGPESPDHDVAHHHDHVNHIHALDHQPVDPASDDSGRDGHHEHYVKGDPYRVVPQKKGSGNGSRQGEAPPTRDAWPHFEAAESLTIDLQGLSPSRDIPSYLLPAHEPDHTGKLATGLSPPHHV